MRHDPLFHTILATDVEKSGARSDALLVRMREDLRRMLSDSLARQRLDIDALTTIDDGDGFRVLLPADVPPHSLLDPFLSRLGIELREHRIASSTNNRLRLRVAMHMGLLYREPSGSFTGTPLKDCARLLDAPAGRQQLAAHPTADMVVLLTDFFYQNVVSGGTTLDPTSFQRIPIRVKETDLHGWAYVPGVAVTPESKSAPDPRPPKPDPAKTPRAESSQSELRVTVNGDHASFRDLFGGNRNG